MTVRGGFDGMEVTPEDRTSQNVSTIDGGGGQHNGLWFSNEQTVTFERIRFTGAKDFAIRKTGIGDLTLRKCRVSSNTFKGNEGFLGNNTDVKSYSSWGTGNFGGVCIGAYATAVELRGCEFRGNRATSERANAIGGTGAFCIETTSGSTVIDGCILFGNVRTGGKGPVTARVALG